MNIPALCTCARINHVHGTERMYQRHRCRCAGCCFAHSEAHYTYKAGGTIQGSEYAESLGVRRRIQALAAIGWSPRMLAQHCDLSAQYLSKLRTDTSHDSIRPVTWREVNDLYNALWNKPVKGTDGKRVITFARRYGYAPPLAWDDDTIDDPAAEPYTPRYQQRVSRDVDEIAVERRIAGDFVHLTRHELRAAVLLLHERGWNPTMISQRLRISGFSVNHHLDAKDTAA